MNTKAPLLAAGIFLATTLAGLGQTTNNPVDAAQASVTGTRGVATRWAVMNFSELPQEGTTPGPHPEADSPLPTDSFPALDAVDPRPPPPDTMGAVGPNHLMVVLNHGVRIQNRSGVVLSTVLLSNFWASVGPISPYYYDNGKPAYAFDSRVLYDPYENRWIVSAFAPTVPDPGSLLIGVSQTSDPTGSWNLYRIQIDPMPGYYLDFPVTGFNKDWILTRGFVTDYYGGNIGSRLYLFNKTNLYAGGTGLYTSFNSGDTLTFVVPATTYDTNLATLYLLNAAGTSSLRSSLRISTITGPVGSEVWTQGPLVTTTNRWSNNGGSFLPQLGSSFRIKAWGDAISSLVYRNGSLWAVQAIYLAGPPGRSAIQWWQLSPRGIVIQRGLIDNPTAGHFFEYSSLAVNKFNDVLIGYNRFATNQYASANYSFRAGNDPPNTLRADTVLKAGEGFYYNTDNSASGNNKWGDYSATCVDPLNDLDLWTIQEYPQAPIQGKGNWATWWGHLVPPTNLALQQSASPTSVLEGQNLTYTLHVNYTGATNVTGVLLTNVLPANVTLLALASSQGNCTNLGGTITCDLGSLTNGNSVTITLGVTPATAGSLTNTIGVGVNENADPTTSTLITLVKADADRDGLADDWEIANSLNPGDASDALLDPDGDAVSNFQEYLAGTSPTNSASVFRITAANWITTGSTPGLRVSFSTVSGRFYRIQRADDLESSAWVIVVDEIPGTGATLAVTDPGAAGQGQRFYRVQVLP